jgi:hypothetical protein
METTRNELPKNVKRFFYELSDYLDTILFYYGSIQRLDYVSDKSDIDVDIFTDNEYSIMNKMQHFLHITKSEFKKFFWIINKTTTYGYKLKYIDIQKNIKVEFAIYNDKFKNVILKEHNRKTDLPIYITCLLYILKILYYKILIFDKETYKYLKRIVLNGLLGDDIIPKFFVVDSKQT